MSVAIQFTAPEGYGSFQKDIRYYYVGNRTDIVDGETKKTVLIAWFVKNAKRKPGWQVQLMTPSRNEFEAALTSIPPKLKPLKVPFNLPVWLAEVDDVNFDEIEERRPTKEKKLISEDESTEEPSYKRMSFRKIAEERLSKIAPALEQREAILLAPDPLKAIAATAYDGNKKKHPHRIQLWFFAFILHENSSWALIQPTHNNGTWSRRSVKHADTKFGCPGVEGTCFGWSSARMREEIVDYYLEKCGTGITMRDIHRDTLIEKYGCIVANDKDGNSTWIHPQNKPFPSYGQFRFVVVDELELPFVQTQIYGAPRMRSKATSNEGNYTEGYANLLEALEVDAYYVKERPKSLYSDDPLEALAVAEAVCLTSGAVVGIGFSLGSETGEAYRSMLFCMAVPKNYIAKIYGIPEENLNWIMHGIPANFISDRGPAGHRGIAERLEQAFPIKTIAPSYTGQAKASVESTHPRDTKLEGAPSYVQSNHNVINMVKREIFRAVAKNHSKNIAPRLSDQAIRDFTAEGRVATPHHYWDYLTKRLRTSARELTLEMAVRAFWTPTELEVDLDGVKLRHRHYTSKEFKDSGFLGKLGKVEGLTIRAYTLSLCLRYVWVEVNGKLIELEAATRIRIDDEEKLVPLSELEETARQLRKLVGKSKISAEAAIGRAEIDFEAVTGKPWNSGTRKPGTPKKASGTVAHEGRVAKGLTSTRKKA
jgi:hypothetical protein